MARTKGPIETDLEQRMWYLADPKVKWVPGCPHDADQACLVYDGRRGAVGGIQSGISESTFCWLGEFVPADGPLGAHAVWLNDSLPDRDSLIWWLEEMIDQAAWEGV